MSLLLRSFILLILYVSSFEALAVTQVTLSNVHMCCATCQDTIEQAIFGVKGTTVNVDRDANKVTISAVDDKVEQAALTAMANAGFYGKSDNHTVTMNDVVVEGKSAGAEFAGFHNCCGSCSAALEEAIKPVAGVQSVTVNKRSCHVNGDFNGASVLKAINNAGFFASIKK